MHNQLLHDFQARYGRDTMLEVLSGLIKEKSLPLQGTSLFAKRFPIQGTAAFAKLPLRTLIQLQQMASGGLFRGK